MWAILGDILCLLLSPHVLAQGDLPPETLLLAKIKVKAEENLERLPNYTCLETIERSTRRPSGKFQLLDLLRMEVAFVGRKELYAWPGSQEFEDRDLFDMVGYGAIGNGSFALHARSVFLSNTPAYSYAGERILEGRRTIRYDYRVPMLHSGYTLRVRPAVGIVGYHGSFWVSAESLDLVRLDVIADEIPPHIPVLSAAETLDYAEVRIGDAGFLLPSSSELVLTDLAHNENRNRIAFSRCRQFTGESVITFEDAPSQGGNVASAKREVVLDSGIELEIKLETAIEAGVSAVGDSVRAVVVRDVRASDTLKIPKGAVVSGRVVKLQRGAGRDEVIWTAGIHLTKIEFGNQYATVDLQMDASVQPSFHSAGIGAGRQMIISQGDVVTDPRIGILYIKGERGRIPAGFRMQWRTLAYKSEEKRDSVRTGR